MEDENNVVAPVADETREVPTENKRPVLDPRRPMSQQVDNLLKQLPVKEDEEPVKDVNTKKGEPEEEQTQIVEEDTSEKVIDNESTEDEIEEDVSEPVELAPWQEYVLENLPNIQVVGHTEGGKDKVYNVKRLEDLPDDFEFSSKRAELAFNAALASQEVNARDLLARWNQQDAANKYQEMQTQDAISVQRDINSLQREGILPKFKYDASDPKFNSDPAVKEANEIYALYEKTNQAYIDQFTKTGQSYKISYRDAADKYYAAKARSERQTPPKEDDKPIKQNPDREKTATRVGSPQGASPDKARPFIRSGTTPHDIYQAYKKGII